jgi:hypothetical protein
MYGIAPFWWTVDRLASYVVAMAVAQEQAVRGSCGLALPDLRELTPAAASIWW